MITTLLASATLLVAQPTDETRDEFCAGLGDLAETIMGAHQDGIPMSDLIRILTEVESEEEEFDTAPAIRRMIRLAYAEPPMRTPENARRQRAEFRTGVELACYDAAANEGREV